MNGTAAFKVLRAVLYTVYLMSASILAIACWTGLIHDIFREKGGLRPLTVIGDITHFLSGQTPTTLVSLSNSLRTEAGAVGVIAGAVFVVGVVFFGRLTNDGFIPSWFGAPTALIALAVFWEIEPRAALWLGTTAMFILFMIATAIEVWHSRYVCGPERTAYMGLLIMNWIFTTAGLVAAPINLVYELKELRAAEAHAAPL